MYQIVDLATPEVSAVSILLQLAMKLFSNQLCNYFCENGLGKKKKKKAVVNVTFLLNLLN